MSRPRRGANTNPPLRIVSLGGGTGLSTLLRGLRSSGGGRELDLAAVVTVSDDGGSSGRLRRDFDILAPGDIRNCMVALAEDEALLSRLFQYRFSSGEGLKGHSFGNLFLAALAEVTGDFHTAIKLSSEVLAIRGRIFPSTLVNVKLEADFESGRSMVGETRITGSRDRIRRIRLRPSRCEPVEDALDAIREADLITFGPGSLYTSVIPNLLVEGVADAVSASKAKKVYICNLMWEPGETDEYTASDHVKAVLDHVDEPVLDLAIVNDRRAPARIRRRYEENRAFQVKVDQERLLELGVEVMATDLLAKGSPLRHDSERLAEILIELAAANRNPA